MARPLSKLAPAWWDYTTLDPEILEDAARIKPGDLLQFSRPGFTVKIYDTVEEFYTAEALEYIEADKVSIWHPGHPNVQFNYLRSGIGSVTVDMH